jgi:hypothetical protein
MMEKGTTEKPSVIVILRAHEVRSKNLYHEVHEEHEDKLECGAFIRCVFQPPRSRRTRREFLDRITGKETGVRRQGERPTNKTPGDVIPVSLCGRNP